MLAIKLRRIGKKHQPAYRVVVAEKRGKPHATGVEDLGWYNPLSKKFELKRERIEYWLKVGARPTDTAHNLLVHAGVVSGAKVPVHKKPKAKKGIDATAAPQEAATAQPSAAATPREETNVSQLPKTA